MDGEEEVIGDVIMDVSEEQMIEFVQYYLNEQLFQAGIRPRHKVKVEGVRQRSNKRFVIELTGEPKSSVRELLNG